MNKITTDTERLITLLKNRRVSHHLLGHGKIAGDRKCICGEPLYPNSEAKYMKESSYARSGGWHCRVEDSLWNNIIILLKLNKNVLYEDDKNETI